MQKQTILENSYVTLWYYPESNIVHHQFHKFTHGQVLRDMLRKGLEVCQHNNTTKWLSDDRKNSILQEVDYEWANNNWVNPMIELGWKYWAIVLPDKAAGKVTMQRVIDDYASRGLTVQIFEDPQEAYTWIESV